jgi:rhamnosyltransferase subunit B
VPGQHFPDERESEALALRDVLTERAGRGIIHADAEAPMHVLISAVGSYGDVYPFIGLARELRRRGHEVVVCTNEHFRPAAEAEGLEFAGVGDAALYEDTVRHPDLWHPTRGIRVVFGTVTRYAPLAYECLLERYRPGETVLVGSTLALGARLLRETHGGALVSVHLAPNVFRSDEDAIRLPNRTIPAGAPRWLKRSFWWLVDRAVIDPMVAPMLNRYRKQLGLAPVKRVFRDWIHSPDAVIGLFPDWFAPPRADWPAQTRLAGFPLYDAAAHEPLPSDLEAFLDAGSPPVLFAPGTANAAAGEFFATSLAACEAAGRRALFVSRFGSQMPGKLPDSARHYDYLPFSAVLPRCSAFVSHGGIGSVSQAFHAGVPQIVRPIGFDQFENGQRAESLGVARVVPVAKYDSAAVAAALDALVTPESAAACRNIAAYFRGSPALAEAAGIVESVAASARATARAAAALRTS